MGKTTFINPDGIELAARLDEPDGDIRGCALFAHCFTCSKDFIAASRISRELKQRGFAVLRFDFTGLGNSDGDFANTNFSSNVRDLVSAAEHMKQIGHTPRLLVGHSLGGAAVLAAAEKIPEALGVATIGAPAEASHVERLIASQADVIEQEGEATVEIGGRRFMVKKQFLEDIRGTALKNRIASLKRALLVYHSPFDKTVGIDNAAAVFTAAKHPKSFISLDQADHLLTDKQDAAYVAETLAAWASRYLG